MYMCTYIHYNDNDHDTIQIKQYHNIAIMIYIQMLYYNV